MPHRKMIDVYLAGMRRDLPKEVRSFLDDYGGMPPADRLERRILLLLYDAFRVGYEAGRKDAEVKE